MAESIVVTAKWFSEVAGCWLFTYWYLIDQFIVSQVSDWHLQENVISSCHLFVACWFGSSQPNAQHEHPYIDGKRTEQQRRQKCKCQLIKSDLSMFLKPLFTWLMQMSANCGDVHQREQKTATKYACSSARSRVRSYASIFNVVTSVLF